MAPLNLIERLFFYMPLQHTEATEVQDESVSAFRRLVGESPPELRSTFEGALEWAEHHRALIRQFGRFPHRNFHSGAWSTPEEVAYLKKMGDVRAVRGGCWPCPQGRVIRERLGRRRSQAGASQCGAPTRISMGFHHRHAAASKGAVSRVATGTMHRGDGGDLAIRHGNHLPCRTSTADT